MSKTRAGLELLFSGILWGFGFVATVWALGTFTPAETLVYRFVVAGLVGEVIYLILQGPRFSSAKADLLRALPGGLLLGSMLLLQTIGLQHTTATKSGFITSLYVVMVPIFNAWFFKQSTGWRSYFLAALALVGTGMLINTNIKEINTGDLWTLACSVLAAFHIIYIGKVSDKVGNAFRFNNFQSLWCLVILTPFLLSQEHIHFNTDIGLPWIGILFLGLGSSLIAFYIQIRAQKTLSDTTASMLFLLESPFAAIFGFLLLQERLSWFQASGAVVIFMASLLEILLASSKTT